MMDKRTGDIYDSGLMDKVIETRPEDLRFFQQVPDENLTPVQKTQLAAKGHTKVRMDEQCPCGSGNPFSMCCFRRR